MSVEKQLRDLPEWFPDKVTEQQMAEILGTTDRALEARRARKQIPEGVWNRLGGRVYYSRSRYEQWLESQWHCPQELSYATIHSAFGSTGTESDALKPLPTPRRKRASQLHPVYAIK
jgi:hypothetical protein